MKKREALPALDLEDLLDRGRSVRPLPELVRARALSRARKVARTPVSLVGPPRARRVVLAGRLAMAAALVLGVAGAAFALGQAFRDQPRREPAPTVVPSQASRAALGFSSAPAASEVHPERASSAVGPTSIAPRPVPRTGTSSNNVESESELMRRAHSAYAERNFGTALRLVSEHAKKYPRGVLAEEREALRVRSLAAAGQTADARRAAAAFAQRFPRSVLIERIQTFAAPNAGRAR